MSGLASVPKSQDILELARRSDPASRGRLLEAIIELSAGHNGPAPPELGALLADLARQAERDIRRRLAARLATAEWAPPALVNILALDEIEISRPLIVGSPVLGEDDLIGILNRAAQSHRLAVAQRPELGERVVNSILDAGEPEVMTALAANPSARISEAGMGRLVDASRENLALQAPLAQHPKLSNALAERMYRWVGESLRIGIAGRFSLDPALLTAAIDGVMDEAQLVPASAPRLQVEDSDTALQNLVDKLDAAGQLRQGYLFKALREGRLRLFYIALARLTALRPRDIEEAACASDPDGLALALAATGMDQAVFLKLLEALRDLNGSLPGGGAEGARKALGAFGHFSPQAAQAAFRQLAGV